MDLQTFLRLANAWSALGWAVQDQFNQILEDPSITLEKNQNAVKMIIAFLEKVQKASTGWDCTINEEARELIEAIKDEQSNKGIRDAVKTELAAGLPTPEDE